MCLRIIIRRDWQVLSKAWYVPASRWVKGCLGGIQQTSHGDLKTGALFIVIPGECNIMFYITR